MTAGKPVKILNLKDAPEYCDALAQWHYTEWAPLYPEENLEVFRADMQSCLGDGIVPSTYIAIERTLVGSVSIIARDLATRPELTPWLANVFVAPAHRGQGIAAALIKHAMTAARAAGLRTLYLFTPGTESFYRKLGWSLLSREQYQGHEVAVMEARLND